ncbi:MAG TPA: hypothetical protein DCW58_00745 [Candidatus Pacebacteria bacterium]|nr:hypothetical protein [Candidatus Paceibacterota bacterium]
MELESHGNENTLAIKKSASVFRNTLASILAEESPFARAPFIARIAEKYLEDKNQSRYFTTKDGFGSNIIIRNGIAQPDIYLNIQKGLESRKIRKRVAIRLDKKDPTDDEVFYFAVGHELGHLIQGLADYVSMADQNVSGMTEAQINEKKRQVDEYNKNIDENKDIKDAQDFFRSIFKKDINRGFNEAYIDVSNYTDETYLSYINSEAEANADFISLWIIGMENPDIRTSPQNEGYLIEDWHRWMEDHKINTTQLA